MKNRIEAEAKFWNSVAEKYDRIIEKRFSEAYRFIIENLAEDAADSEELLEIATGTGILALKLSDRVAHITAIDIAPEMLEVARKKSDARQIDNVAFKFGDACDLPFGDRTFDTIIASNVAHLLSEPELAFQEMNRVLKDHGKIIVPTFCHGANLRTRILSKLMRLVGQQTKHRWSRKGFRKFVEQNGFKVTKDSYLDGIIPLAYLVAEKNHRL